jgi:hypothetical protein
MRRILVAVAVVLLLVSPVLAQGQNNARMSVGGGLTRSTVTIFGESLDFNPGPYAVLVGRWDNGMIVRGTMSRSRQESKIFFDVGFGPELFTVRESVERTDISIGFLFRRLQQFRPMIHGGLSYFSLKEHGDTPTFKDSDTGLTIGGGFEVGYASHAFYFDVNLDDDYDWLDGSLEWREVHIGYLYRFP